MLKNLQNSVMLCLIIRKAHGLMMEDEKRVLVGEYRKSPSFAGYHIFAPVVDILTTCCASLKRIAEKFTHVTLFDVNIDSLKNRKNVLNFVTQTCKSPAGVMIETLFTDGTYLRVK